MKRIVLSLLSFYQKAISPYMGHRCRYIPTCSEFTKESIEHRGVLRGGGEALRRIFRCAPWGGSGWDPVSYEQK